MIFFAISWIGSVCLFVSLKTISLTVTIWRARDFFLYMHTPLILRPCDIDNMKKKIDYFATRELNSLMHM